MRVGALRLGLDLLPYGKSGARLIGDRQGAIILDTTVDRTPEIVIRLPDGWTLAATVEITDGTTTYGPFDTTLIDPGIYEIEVDESLPVGTYRVVGTPATDTNSRPRKIFGQLTIAGEVAFMWDDLAGFCWDDSSGLYIEA